MLNVPNIDRTRLVIASTAKQSHAYKQPNHEIATAYGLAMTNNKEAR